MSDLQMLIYAAKCVGRLDKIGLEMTTVNIRERIGDQS